MFILLKLKCFKTGCEKMLTNNGDEHFCLSPFKYLNYSQSFNVTIFRELFVFYFSINFKCFPRTIATNQFQASEVIIVKISIHPIEILYAIVTDISLKRFSKLNEFPPPRQPKRK